MGICVFKSNICVYLYHVLQEVSEVVLLVDKHLDVATRIGELWHTGCVNKEGREEGKRQGKFMGKEFGDSTEGKEREREVHISEGNL